MTEEEKQKVRETEAMIENVRKEAEKRREAAKAAQDANADGSEDEFKGFD